jgi:hypothetical protein
MALDNTSSPGRPTAFMSALVTEHFVLQTAASATVTEAASRTSLYVFSLSSSLVTMGFVSQFPETFRLFAAAILPALFILGLFTTVRLVDTGIENQHFLRGIARIRGYYRTLTPKPPCTSRLRVDAGRRCMQRRRPRRRRHCHSHDRFLAYQRWRYRATEAAASNKAEPQR